MVLAWRLAVGNFVSSPSRSDLLASQSEGVTSLALPPEAPPCVTAAPSRRIEVVVRRPQIDDWLMENPTRRVTSTTRQASSRHLRGGGGDGEASRASLGWMRFPTSANDMARRCRCRVDQGMIATPRDEDGGSGSRVKSRVGAMEMLGIPFRRTRLSAGSFATSPKWQVQ